jgi:hypothetical protein
MEMTGQLQAMAALLEGKELRYPLQRRLGGSTAGLDAVE